MTFADQEDVAGAVADSLGGRPDIVVDADETTDNVALDLVRRAAWFVLASTKGTKAVNQLFSDVIVLKELTMLVPLQHRPPGHHWVTCQLAADPRLDTMVVPSTKPSGIQATAGDLGRYELMAGPSDGRQEPSAWVCEADIFVVPSRGARPRCTNRLRATGQPQVRIP